MVHSRYPPNRHTGLTFPSSHWLYFSWQALYKMHFFQLHALEAEPPAVVPLAYSTCPVKRACK